MKRQAPDEAEDPPVAKGLQHILGRTGHLNTEAKVDSEPQATELASTLPEEAIPSPVTEPVGQGLVWNGLEGTRSKSPQSHRLNSVTCRMQRDIWTPGYPCTNRQLVIFVGKRFYRFNRAPNEELFLAYQGFASSKASKIPHKNTKKKIQKITSTTPPSPYLTPCLYGPSALTLDFCGSFAFCVALIPPSPAQDPSRGWVGHKNCPFQNTNILTRFLPDIFYSIANIFLYLSAGPSHIFFFASSLGFFFGPPIQSL